MDDQTVAEIFKDRFTSRATEFGLVKDFVCDLTTGWDLNVPQRRDEALAMVDERKPSLLITSPRRTGFSTLLNSGSVGTIKDETKRAIVKDCANHLKACIAACEKQLADGRYFLHEVPDVDSMKNDCVLDILKKDGVMYVSRSYEKRMTARSNHCATNRHETTRSLSPSSSSST